MSYNVLNFPMGFMPDRQDTLKKILDYVQPDILLIQELRNAYGLELILEESFADVPGAHKSSTFIPLQSNQNSDFALQQAIVYDTLVFGMAEERLKTTPTRDINIHKMFFKEENLSVTQDTSFLYIFNTHLKSSQGENNEQLRLAAAQIFVNELANLDPDIPILFGGDFNLYTSDEPAYQLLLDEENAIQMEDPINAPGNWTSSSYPFKQILTQSTRFSQIYDDGAGGGLDDRFDFVLASSNLLDGSGPVSLDPSTYVALSNNGTCYNQNITQCIEDNDVPSEIIWALYYMSDHLPVVFDLELDFTLGTENSPAKADVAILQYGNAIMLGGKQNEGLWRIQLYDLNGRMLDAWNRSTGNMIRLDQFETGIYVVLAENDKGERVTRKLLLQ